MNLKSEIRNIRLDCGTRRARTSLWRANPERLTRFNSDLSNSVREPRALEESFPTPLRAVTFRNRLFAQGLRPHPTMPKLEQRKAALISFINFESYLRSSTRPFHG